VPTGGPKKGEEFLGGDAPPGELRPPAPASPDRIGPTRTAQKGGGLIAAPAPDPTAPLRSPETDPNEGGRYSRPPPGVEVVLLICL
jgi:hypothetical protein